MKKILALALLLTAPLHATVPMWQNVPSTTTGTSLTYLSGSMKVYPSTGTAAANPAIWLDAINKLLTVRNGVNVSTVAAAGVYSPAFYGAATGLTAIPSAQLTGGVPTSLVNLSTVTTAIATAVAPVNVFISSFTANTDGRVLKAGDTMTGPLGIGGAPTFVLDIFGTTIQPARFSTTVDTNYLMLTNSGGSAYIHSNNNDLVFDTAAGANERMRIAQSGAITMPDGNFSVGGGSLSVNNGLTMLGVQANSNTAPLRIVSKPNGESLSLLGTGSAYDGGLQFFTAGANVFDGGIYGINTPTNRIALFDKNSAEVMTINTGNVGIGTKSPAAKLSIVQSVAGVPFISSGTTGHMEFTNGVVGQSRLKLVSFPGSSNAIGWTDLGLGINSWSLGTKNMDSAMYLSTSYDLSAPQVTVLASGHVGVGTITPVSKLTIKTASPSTFPFMVEDDNSTNIVGGIYESGAGHGGLYLYADGQIEKVSLQTGANSHISGGNLGIGTASPDQKLTVAGNISQTGNFISSGTGSNYFYGSIYANSAGNALFSVQGGAGGYQGQINISADGPSNADDTASIIKKNSGMLYITNYQNELPAGGAGAIAIDNSQNIGLGTGSPSARFHVVGNVVLSSNTALTTYTETKSSAAVSTNYDVSWASGSVTWLTLNASTTLTFSSPVSGKTMTFFVKQGGAGGYALTWPTILWPSGTAPTLTTTAQKVDIITVVNIDGVYYGFVGGKNY